MKLVNEHTIGVQKQVLAAYDLAGGDKYSDYVKIKGMYATVLVDATDIVGDITVRPVISASSLGTEASFSEIEIDEYGTLSEFTVSAGSIKTVPYNGVSNLFLALKIVVGASTGTVKAYITA